MGPDDVFAYAEKLRAAGIEEVTFDLREFVDRQETTGEDGLVLGCDYVTRMVAGVTRIRLAPHWSPPDKPADEPVFDADPQANAIAAAEYRRKQMMKDALALIEEEDRIRYAHTEGT